MDSRDAMTVASLENLELVPWRLPMKVAAFMATPLGRGLRVALGAAMIYVGLSVIHGTGGTVLAVLGLLPVVAGLMNLCILGLLLGAPLKGSSLPRS